MHSNQTQTAAAAMLSVRGWACSAYTAVPLLLQLLQLLILLLLLLRPLLLVLQVLLLLQSTQYYTRKRVALSLLVPSQHNVAHIH
jgi:hypothetical protein